MRLWPKTEKRASLDGSSIDATDLLIQARLQAASTSAAVIEATAAHETAAGIIGRGFAAARAEGDTAPVGMLTPTLLGMLGRSLVKRGEFVALIDSDMTLTPAASWTVTGTAKEWLYGVTLGGPSTTETRRNVPAADVIHVMWAVDPEQPWQGLAPLKVARIAGRLSAEIAQALADEASAAHGRVLPQQHEAGSEEVTALTTTLKGANGGTVIVEDPNIALGQLQGSSSTATWQARRFGLDFPEQAVSVMGEATAEVLNACGISTAILRANDAASAREAWRQLLFGTIAPVARTVQHELQAKLGAVTLVFDELRASDLQGRARSFQALTGGGMDADRAATLCGFEDGE